MAYRPTYFLVLLIALVASISIAQAREITDARGETVAVPDNPERVVALTSVDLDTALALDVTPVATLNGRGQSQPPHYLQKQVPDIAVVGNFPQPSLGRLIELKPDLILAGGLPDAQLVHQLGRIAPTVVTYELGDSWRAALNNAAAALDKRERAKDVVEHYQSRTRSVADSLCVPPDTTISIVRWNARGPSYMHRDAFASAIVRDVGLARPPAQREPGMRHSPPLSLEALSRIDADWLFVGTLKQGGDAVQALEAIHGQPAYKQLKAVQADHVVDVDGSVWTSLAGPVGAEQVLDDLQDALGGC